MRGTTFQKALRAVADDARRREVDHPSPADLLAYHAGELDPGRSDALRDHLAACHECARAVLDISRFPDVVPVDEERSLDDRQVDEGTLAIREAVRDAAVRDAEPGPRAIGHPPPTRQARRPLLSRVAWPLAAVLALALVGRSLQVRSLREPLVHLGEAASLGSLERSGEADTRPVVFEEGVEGIPLVFDYYDPDRPPFDDYGIAIEDTGGRVVWSEDGVRKPAGGAFGMVLRRDHLAGGIYRVTLYGAVDGRRETLVDQRIRVTYR